MAGGDNRDDRTARQISRGKTKKLGDKSTRLAHVVMEMKESAVKRLELEEDLRDAIDRARKVETLIARRRAERTLAGDLRRFDLADLEGKIRDLETNAVDVRKFHLAEHWRTKLIDDGVAALAEFPNAAAAADEELPRLMDAARREKATGKPPGAAKKLFRRIMELLDPADAPAVDDVDDGDDE